MHDEKEPQTSAPQPSAKEGQGPTPGQQRRRQKSVFQYLVILFAAAFVLLLYTFMMERRQFEALQQESAEQIDDLQQSSITAVNSLNNLLAENETLKEKLADLEEQLQQQTQSYQSGQTVLHQTIDSQEKSLRAMDWFWQINEAYVRGRTTRCQELIQSIQDAGLVESLPRESITDNGRFSPYDRYQEILESVSE